MLDAVEMGRNKDLSDFDKGQIVMARRLGQSISEMARPVVSSGENLPSVVRGGTNHKWGKGCWAAKAHQCTRALKAIPSGPSQQKVYCGTRNFNDGEGRNVITRAVNRLKSLIVIYRTLRLS
ncbi:hypothetical protein DPX16_14114 [Anabarilius grahami]|uniref:Uncharacterized protein n=1 Tax=Anabarilius grahami TaxID=495550 RepID=A0A3N0Y965_ANAGA|nr:hypothetical protein DPX16_14114 [Anabarilius grahami]